ncbi:MAG: alpha/beta hydrolase [Culicoidibacterales bacterium]
MNGFILLFIIFLFLTWVISYQIYRELFHLTHTAKPTPESIHLLGERITFSISTTDNGYGFYQKATRPTDRVILLVHDHFHSATQVFPLVQYFHNLGFDVLTYDQTANKSPRSFRFGHYHTEGKACLALLNWYQTHHQTQVVLGAAGIGFGATTLVQLHKHGLEFDFLILEQLPVSFSQYLDTKITKTLSSFWWRNLINKIILSKLNNRALISLESISNLVSCDVPTLLLHSQNHPLTPSDYAYRFLPYYHNSQAFIFTKNYHNSGIYSEPERYFFLLDTFLKQFPTNFSE